MTQLALDRGVHFECCPTSSYLTGGFAPRPRPWSDHPLKHFFSRGMSCGINSDDPLMCGVCLEDEFRLCVGEMGFGRDDEVRSMTENAIRAAFCTADEKSVLMRRVAEFYEQGS